MSKGNIISSIERCQDIIKQFCHQQTSNASAFSKLQENNKDVPIKTRSYNEGMQMRKQY